MKEATRPSRGPSRNLQFGTKEHTTRFHIQVCIVCRGLRGGGASRMGCAAPPNDGVRDRPGRRYVCVCVWKIDHAGPLSTASVPPESWGMRGTMASPRSFAVIFVVTSWRPPKCLPCRSTVLASLATWPLQILYELLLWYLVLAFMRYLRAQSQTYISMYVLILSCSQSPL